MTSSSKELSIIEEAKKRVAGDLPLFAAKLLKIRPKAGGLVPLVYNPIQMRMHLTAQKQLEETGMVRVICLKARQFGGSTYIGSRLYHKTTHSVGLKSLIMTHEKDATAGLFQMVKRFHDNCPTDFRPRKGYDSTSRLTFPDIDAEYVVATAGNRNAGHSQTIHNALLSEASRWKYSHDHAAGILQTISKSPGTEVWVESTANGTDNWFSDAWTEAVAGTSGFIPFFAGWNEHAEYTLDLPFDGYRDAEEEEIASIHKLTNGQILWRRMKIGELGGDLYLFKQQYPLTPAEAFESSGEGLIGLNSVSAAMRGGAKVEDYGAVIFGLDPAHMGKDTTALAIRKGRKVLAIHRFQKMQPMEITGRLVQFARVHQPQKIFIDVAYGTGIYDRLREMGMNEVVEMVNFGSGAMYREDCANRRTEMYLEIRDWLKAPPVILPLDLELETELTAPGFTYDSKGRVILESKDKLRGRLRRSPDAADALALTFAMPVASPEAERLMTEYGSPMVAQLDF